MMVLGFQANADYFKWELEVFAEGPGTRMETIPVIDGESLFKWGKDGNCRISDAWTRLEPELTIEGKPFFVKKERKESLSVSSAVTTDLHDAITAPKKSILNPLLPIFC